MVSVYFSSIIALASWFAVTAVASSNDAVSVTKFDHFVKVPTTFIHTGGRLTERGIGYIAAAGYKSILSVVEFATNDTVYNGVAGAFPSSAYESQLAADYGLSAKYLASSLTAASLAEIDGLLNSLPRPVYMHCHVSALLLLLLLLQLALTIKIHHLF